MSDTTSSPPRRSPLMRYLARFDDGEVMRWAFRGLLAGTIAVLALDVKALVDERGGLWGREPARQVVHVEPVLPPVVTTGEPGRQTVDPRQNVTGDQAALRLPLRFELLPGGVLSVEGSIDQGAARRFAEEVERRGEYVSTVALNSPGGSLDDAMEMSRLVRERGFDTRVLDGAICASSCPLVLAGGVSRTVAERSAIGLHQFYAVTGTALEPAQAMSDAQATTARISRHLDGMGVDPALWLHALDTPPQSLYYLTGEEMRRYRLVNIATTLASRGSG